MFAATISEGAPLTDETRTTFKPVQIRCGSLLGLLVVAVYSLYVIPIKIS